ncbi:unnamed protein product [Adineta ricciae]|uniref:Phthiocerol/phthiodiolone dimycocerosyl transferase C-terminal domain-containing protein n=1 Tax=Adineta ricciae TaxID=249248 RepID=A0A814ULW2_ADIRI|nr:unnamed protein product [Adineta ricciae]CAF1177406.1 unnamed protein product [Adineta ricciae]
MFSWFRQGPNTDADPKQHLMGSAENALMQASHRFQGYMKFGEVLHLQGPWISVDMLSRAICHLQRRHPILRTRLRMVSDKSDSFFLEEDETVRLKIRDIARKRTDCQTFWRDEWRQRERDTTAVGEGLVEFWLLQDPEDIKNNNSPQEIMVISEHAVSDGLSLSNLAHELLIALSDENEDLFKNSLDWPITMETAIQNSLTMLGRVMALTRFIFSAVYLRSTNRLPTARVPLASIEFPLTDLINHSHTEASYLILNKEDTQVLLSKCRQQNVTVTSAVSAAILCVLSTFVKSDANQPTLLNFSIGADTRRRCTPPIPNHDLRYHVSGLMSFTIPTNDIPTTTENIWQLARNFGEHMKSCVDAGQILALGLIMGKLYQKTLGEPNLNELPTCGVSSWGILPFKEEYGQWKFLGMTPFVNMIRAVMPFTTIQTVNGVLTVMYVGTDPVISKTVLEGLRESTMNKLQQMIHD